VLEYSTVVVNDNEDQIKELLKEMKEVDAKEREYTPLKDEVSQDNVMDIACDDDTNILTTRSDV
jgi:hypothetical protein